MLKQGKCVHRFATLYRTKVELVEGPEGMEKETAVDQTRLKWALSLSLPNHCLSHDTTHMAGQSSSPSGPHIPVPG